VKRKPVILTGKPVTVEQLAKIYGISKKKLKQLKKLVK